jgi:hypothetical protein
VGSVEWRVNRDGYSVLRSSILSQLMLFNIYKDTILVILDRLSNLTYMTYFFCGSMIGKMFNCSLCMTWCMTSQDQ